MNGHATTLLVHLRDHVSRAALDLGLEPPPIVDTQCGADAPGLNVCHRVEDSTCPAYLEAERTRLKVLVRTVGVILDSPGLRPASGPQLTGFLELADELRAALKRAASWVDDVVRRLS
jgi:hypothetical protein